MRVLKKRFKTLLERLGKSGNCILESGIKPEEIAEIRYNVNRPLLIRTLNDRIISGKTVSLAELREIFASLCEYSVHTYKNEICEGFITIDGGFRVGICGTAVYDNGKIMNIKHISSLNIRIPHEIFGISNALIGLKSGGILVIGPPCSGKTTLLRDFARQISKEKFTVIVDERMEISGTYRGEPYFDIGQASVLNGFTKTDGIKIAARTMSPDYIICDEFGDENDICSALYAMKSGVYIAASMHAADEKDFLNKPFSKNLISSMIFNTFIFLNKNREIYSIKKAEDFSL